MSRTSDEKTFRYRLGTVEASEALLADIYVDLRRKLKNWANITHQTPQARMGYIGQHLTSVVTGYRGKKSGARGDDLLITASVPGEPSEVGEIKTCYRVDQLDTSKNSRVFGVDVILWVMLRGGGDGEGCSGTFRL